MDEGEDYDSIGFDLINEPVAKDDELADRRILELGDDAAALAEGGKR